MHLINTLKKYNIIQTGNFTLKSGQQSNLYFDFKNVITYPNLLTDICYELSKLLTNGPLCGVPLGGLPYTILLSHITSRPMILIRDEKKSYGLQKQIEGEHVNEVILIEDVITTGASVLNCIKLLKKNNINVKQIICILDRQSGGVEKIKQLNYDIKSLFRLDDIVNYDQILNIKQCDITLKLMDIMKNKKTNIIASLDCENMYEIMEQIGDHVCAIKIHGDIFDKLNVDKINKLKQQYNFMIIEDRKFSDIPYICLKQLEKIKKYADIVTVHGLCGELVVKELGKQIGVILVHSMSVKDNLIDRLYINKVLDMKCNNLVGYVSQEKIEGCLTFMPGINMDTKSDNLGQCYRQNTNADFFIIGRGIYEGNVLKNILLYKQLYWK